jgi:hypothetical protein
MAALIGMSGSLQQKLLHAALLHVPGASAINERKRDDRANH